MKLPFERNNYFSGKLLSAGDFQAEQRYFDEKRHMLNRLVQGGGVICGMDVLKMDDKAIQVQTGAALDFAGREILVHRPITQKLALVEGFDYKQNCGFSYLCAGFSETLCDEAFSIEDDGRRQYNRIREGCRIFLTDKPPSGRSEPANLDEALDESGYVYLAKIYHVMGDQTYYIDRVEDLRKYINDRREPAAPPKEPDTISTDLAEKIEKILKDHVRITCMQPTVSSGVARITLGLKGKKDRLFCSDPIDHGLGKGYVSISAGILGNEDAEQLRNGGRSVMFGDARVFGHGMATSVKLDTGTGTFIIGVRLLENTVYSDVYVYWMAVRNNAEEISQATLNPYMEIKPTVANIACREVFAFQISGSGVDVSSAVWKVKEADGGTIDNDGVYRAPNNPGIYEIRANIGERTAIAFAIVR